MKYDNAALMMTFLCKPHPTRKGGLNHPKAPQNVKLASMSYSHCIHKKCPNKCVKCPTPIKTRLDTNEGLT
jgi:hypothetical protein